MSALLHAKMVDGIAMIVEGEPITTAEIRAIQTQSNVSKADAIDLLIQDRLQKYAMKDIDVTENEIDERIEKIASKNALTVPEMQNILKKQGTPWMKYRSSIKEGIKKEHFYQSNVVTSTPEPNSDELKLYYTKNKKDFTIPTKISLIEYSAASKENITKFLRTYKKSYVKSKKSTKNVKDIESSILTILLSTPVGKYTPTLNAGNKYITYKVLSKNGRTTMPYKTAKDAVATKWKQEYQQKALKDYFQKLRTRANIQILR